MGLTCSRRLRRRLRRMSGCGADLLQYGDAGLGGGYACGVFRYFDQLASPAGQRIDDPLAGFASVCLRASPSPCTTIVGASY
jgi:hypothetical protein